MVADRTERANNRHAVADAERAARAIAAADAANEANETNNNNENPPPERKEKVVKNAGNVHTKEDDSNATALRGIANRNIVEALRAGGQREVAAALRVHQK